MLTNDYLLAIGEDHGHGHDPVTGVCLTLFDESDATNRFTTWAEREPQEDENR